MAEARSGDPVGDSEGSGKPAAAAKSTKAERQAARAANRKTLTAANKRGELRTFGDDRAPAVAK
ncbi:hypothetical protein GT347_01095 [Xylophilus rhododendri]|uniref:Uncharacterized protein n=1 Tax=Xylophilus rhododendri TaxID=2697032 RepID=A0A857J167_9BURK|nr:hypothetical protein [Xylophilus rhododendri]QHI96708.1 hypothetical protein GT347_01095 [Xylophilus rhododendri]